MNTNLYFIRHGKAHNPDRKIYGSTIDVDLSPEGVQQICAAARVVKMQGIRPAVIYSSHLTRGVKSAHALQNEFGQQIPLKVDPELRDTDEPGLANEPIDKLLLLNSVGLDEYSTLLELEAMKNDLPAETYAKVAEVLQKFKNTEIETKPHMIQRIEGAINRMLEAHRGGTVISVTHGDPFVFWRWKKLHPEGQVIPSIPKLEKQGDVFTYAEVDFMQFDPSNRMLRESRIVDERMIGETISEMRGRDKEQ